MSIEPRRHRPYSVAFPAFLAVIVLLFSAPANGAPVASEKAPIDRLPYIYDIAVDPSDTASLVLATRAGLYRAGPDGRAVLVSSQIAPMLNIVAHPSDVGVFYARGSGVNRVMVRSRDSGRSWHLPQKRIFEPRQLRSFDISKVDPSVVYGANYRLWVSQNGGASWNQVGSAPLHRIVEIATSGLDVQSIYAATGSGLISSRDGGWSWHTAYAQIPRQPITAVATGSDGVVYAFGLRSGLIRGDERTGQWTVVDSRFSGCVIQHLTVAPRDSQRLYAVLRCHKVLASVDGGLTWRDLGAQRAWEPDCVASWFDEATLQHNG